MGEWFRIDPDPEPNCPCEIDGPCKGACEENDMYDEPDWEEPVTTNDPLKIEVTGWTLNSLFSVIVDKTMSLASKKIDEAVETTVRDVIEKKIAAMTEAAVAPIIDKVLADGWPVTDNYGRENGRKGVKDLVIDHLAKRDYYNSSRSWMDERIQETMKRIVDKAMEADIAAAQKKLRAEFDELLRSKVAATLREALGLRT